MDRFANLSEEEIINIIMKHFEAENFKCKIHHLIFTEDRISEFDLVCRSSDKKLKETLFIDVKTSEAIFSLRDFIIKKNRVADQLRSPFYRFYLCINSSTTLADVAKQELAANEIGLIRVNRDGVESIEKPESITKMVQDILSKPFDQFTRMDSDHPEMTKYTNEKLQELTSILLLSKSEPYKLRIAGELIDKLDKLSKLGYSELLIEFKKEYETVYNANDENKLILKTLGKLWEKYGKAQGARTFNSFEKFEPILKEIPGYRDHMIHPFQVFLMGSIIIDGNYDFFVSTHKKRFDSAQENSLEFAWLLCSTFHDICYPIQKYEQFSQKFFLEFLQSDNLPIVFQAEKLLTKNDNLKYIDQLVILFEHYTKTENDWKFDSPCKIDHKLRSEMINEISNKNHAPLGAIALIKKTLEEDFVKANLENYKQGRFSTDIYPAALAIALHDEKMLSKIRDSISLDEMPLIFLLVYCDLVQECGRSEEDEDVELHSFICNATNIETTLSFTKKPKFEDKTMEMQRIYKKIVSNSFHFKLNVRFSGSTRSEDSFKEAKQK
jgi:hypothetical protein